MSLVAGLESMLDAFMWEIDAYLHAGTRVQIYAN